MNTQNLVSESMLLTTMLKKRSRTVMSRALGGKEQRMISSVNFREVACVIGLVWDACHFVTEEEGPVPGRLPKLLGMGESHFSEQRPTGVSTEDLV